MMEIEVALTLDDYAAPDRHTPAARPNFLLSARRCNWIGLLLALPFCGALIVGGVVAQIALGPLMLLVGIVIGAALVFLFMLRWLIDISRLGLRASAAFADLPENRWLFEKHRITLHPEALEITAPATQTRHQWSLVCKTEVTPEHVLFYVSSNSAVVVPRRAFRDQAHFEQFVGYANLCKQGRATDALAKILARNPPRDSKGIWDPESSY